MTFTHELGHIVGGVCCGGKLTDADLLPWHLPYSFFNPDPYPLVTLWCGPLLGVLVPVLIAWMIRHPWAWFVAYFCVLANGTYLSVAWYTGEGQLDAAKLIRHGAHPITIAIYCLVTISVGYRGFRHCCVGVLDDHDNDSTNAEPTSTLHANEPNQEEPT